MDQAAIFLSELAVLYIIAGVGYLAKRVGILEKKADDFLTRLILYITLPALILFAMNRPFSPSLAKNFLILILLSAYALGLAALKAYFYIKEKDLPASRQGVQQGLIIFGNQGFLGYAISQILFAQEGIMYTAVFNILYLMLIWTYGIYLVAKSNEAFQWKTLLNPGTVATFLGLLIFLLPLELPLFISKLFQSLGSPTTPLSMLLIGSFLADWDLSKIWNLLKNKHLWQASFIKLVVLPILLVPFIFFGIDFTVVAISVLLTAMPSAPTIPLYAKKYDKDVAYASVGVCISTLFLPVTLPLLYLLLSILY